MDAENPKLVEVYRAASPPLAHTVRLMLEAEGITTFVDGDFLQNALGEVPLGSVTEPRVLVKEADQTRARGLIEKSEKDRAQALVEEANATTETVVEERVKCLACGTPMDNQDTCPNCGWSYEEPSETEPP